MNNVISVSGGNDSVAMLIVIDRLRKQDPKFFENDSWHAVYFNTGWARTGWEKRVDLAKSICKKANIEFHELTASARNEVYPNENDELFEQLPEQDSTGMIAHIKKKGALPHTKMKWCTAELKIKPMQKWLKKQKFTPKNTVQWIGVRAEEGGRLGGLAGGNENDRAFTTSLGDRDGFDSIHPLAYMSKIQRDRLLKSNNIEIYQGRSEECYPCIFQMKISDIANLDKDRVELINDLEVKITNFRKAKKDLMGVKYGKNEFFGMFAHTKLGNKQGIKAQQKWAIERQKYLDSLPTNQRLFGDDDIIDDKCNSGYCGL